jgi:hypothetical protein
LYSSYGPAINKPLKANINLSDAKILSKIDAKKGGRVLYSRLLKLFMMDFSDYI